MTSPIFHILVSMANKFLRGEEALALEALHAARGGRGVGLGQHQPLAPPEAVVLDFERKW